MKDKGEKRFLTLKIIIISICIFLIIEYEFILFISTANSEYYLYFAIIVPVIVVLEGFIIVITISSSIERKRFNIFEFKGSGTKEEPFIIDSKADFPRSITIKKMKFYIHFQNCELSSLILYKNKNCKLESCRFTLLDLDSCSDIEIINSFIDDELTLENCQKIKIEDSSINKISLYSSSSNIVKNCKIKVIENEYSYGNTFDKNKVLKKELTKLTITPSIKRIGIKNILKKNFLEIILILGAIYCALFFSFYIFDDPFSIIISTIIMLLILLIIIFIFICLSPNKIKNIKLRKKGKLISKLPPNKVIELNEIK